MTHTSDAQISPDLVFYDEEPVASKENHQGWMREIEFYFHGYSSWLDNSLKGTQGVVAELGAGSCGLSMCLSRLPSIHKIFSLDISSKRMQKMISLSGEILGGSPEKIETIAADFNVRLPFEDASLDAVLFDAALHHSRSMWNLLGECNRVLRKGGVLIAQRESYLSPVRARNQLNHLLLTPEVSASVTENMYLKDQYLYYMSVSGFEGRFIKRTQSSLKAILSFLNGGLFFTDGILIGGKK